jgi:hypothetical protein
MVAESRTAPPGIDVSTLRDWEQGEGYSLSKAPKEGVSSGVNAGDQTSLYLRLCTTFQRIPENGRENPDSLSVMPVAAQHIVFSKLVF